MNTNMLHHSIHGTLELPPASEPVRDPTILSGNLSLEDMPVPADERESGYDYDGPVSDEPAALALEGNIEDESPRAYEPYTSTQEEPQPAYRVSIVPSAKSDPRMPMPKYDIRNIGDQIPDAESMTPEERKAWSKAWSDKMWDKLTDEGAIIADGPVPERDTTDYSNLPEPPSFGAKIAARMQAASDKVESALKAGAKRAAQTRIGEKVFTPEGGLTDRGKKIAIGIGVVAGTATIVAKAYLLHKFSVDMATHSPVADMAEKMSRDEQGVFGPTKITGSAVPHTNEVQIPTITPIETSEVTPPTVTPSVQTPIETPPVPNPGNIEQPIPPVEPGMPPRPDTIQLAPGETVWGRLQETMSPNATNQDMVNELVRFFEANQLPINWDSDDPFEAARSITPSQVLLMPK